MSEENKRKKPYYSNYLTKNGIKIDDKKILTYLESIQQIYSLISERKGECPDLKKYKEKIEKLEQHIFEPQGDNKIKFKKKFSNPTENLDDLIMKYENKTKNYFQYNQKYNNKIIKSISIGYNGIAVGLKSYISSQTIKGFKKGFDFEGMIGATNISEAVLPIVDYINELKPEMIVACDRGARFIGLAVHMLYTKLNGRLPTTDGTLRFRKLTKNLSREENLETLRPLVKEALTKSPNPTMLFLDDWVASGATQKMIKELVSELSKGKVDVKFGVLLGGNADISGDSSKGAFGFRGTVDWHDAPEKTGVDYRGAKPKPLRTEESLKYRRTMMRSIETHVEKIKSSQEPKPKKEKASTSIDFSDPFFQRFCSEGAEGIL